MPSRAGNIRIWLTMIDRCATHGRLLKRDPDIIISLTAIRARATAEAYKRSRRRNDPFVSCTYHHVVEKGLKNNCKKIEERITRCREVLPICEQIVRLRIGLGELLAFHTDASRR
jgi:hypothetical protein